MGTNEVGGGYVIRQGDTLTKIADRFGVSVQSLQAANGIENPNLIFAGDTLKIPSQVLTDDDMKVMGTYIEHNDDDEQITKKIKEAYDELKEISEEEALEILKLEEEKLDEEKRQLEQQIKDYESGTNNTEKPN